MQEKEPQSEKRTCDKIEDNLVKKNWEQLSTQTLACVTHHKRDIPRWKSGQSNSNAQHGRGETKQNGNAPSHVRLQHIIVVVSLFVRLTERRRYWCQKELKYCKSVNKCKEIVRCIAAKHSQSDEWKLFFSGKDLTQLKNRKDLTQLLAGRTGPTEETRSSPQTTSQEQRWRPGTKWKASVLSTETKSTLAKEDWTAVHYECFVFKISFKPWWNLFHRSEIFQTAGDPSLQSGRRTCSDRQAAWCWRWTTCAQKEIKSEFATWACRGERAWHNHCKTGQTREEGARCTVQSSGCSRRWSWSWSLLWKDKELWPRSTNEMPNELVCKLSYFMSLTFCILLLCAAGRSRFHQS